jgi:hypothetical protein
VNWGVDCEAAARPVWIDAAALPPGTAAAADEIHQVLHTPRGSRRSVTQLLTSHSQRHFLSKSWEKVTSPKKL